MNEPQNLGQKGENHAAAFLEGKGYKIRHRNWRTGKMEVDIIAENNEYVVFVEVKTRTGDFLVNPQDTVSREKQRFMQFAADNYIKKYDINKEGRFDVVSLIWDGKSFAVDHIEGAFYPTLR